MDLNFVMRNYYIKKDNNLNLITFCTCITEKHT